MNAVRQSALTLVAPVELGRERELDSWLRRNERALQRALQRSQTTHFARWALLPPTPDEAGSTRGASHFLAFESNFDGELPAHVSDLRASLGPLFDDAFRGVVGYPGAENLAALVEFFRGAASLRSAVFFASHPGLSVPIIHGDAALKRAVDARLAQLTRGGVVPTSSALPLALELQRAAREVAEASGLALGRVERGLKPAPVTRWQAALRRPLAFVVVFLLAPWFELRDELVRWRQPRFDTPELRAQRDRIGAEEDRIDQNGLTHLVALKPGRYRALALELMLQLLAALAEAGALTGRLGGISTIHFARWVRLPDRRLLFFSNYDGSSEAQLSDFVDQAAPHLTMIWTHTIWYPKTHFLRFRGARDEPAFKRWMRAHQVPTPVWYSAYPALSVADVQKNAELRELLGSELDSRRAERLLGLL